MQSRDSVNINPLDNSDLSNIRSNKSNGKKKLKMVDPVTGKEITQDQINQGIKGVSSYVFRSRRLVNPQTGMVLSKDQINQGEKGIPYVTYKTRRLVDPKTGVTLTENQIKQGVKGIHYSTYQSRKIVDPNTGITLTPTQIQMGAKGISYSTYKNHRLVDPLTGRWLKKHEIDQGKAGVRYSFYKNVKKPSVSIKTETITTKKQNIESPSMELFSEQVIKRQGEEDLQQIAISSLLHLSSVKPFTAVTNPQSVPEIKLSKTTDLISGASQNSVHIPAFSNKLILMKYPDISSIFSSSSSLFSSFSMPNSFQKVNTQLGIENIFPPQLNLTVKNQEKNVPAATVDPEQDAQSLFMLSELGFFKTKNNQNEICPQQDETRYVDQTYVNKITHLTQ